VLGVQQVIGWSAVGFGALFGAFLFQGLAGFLRHCLARGFVCHVRPFDGGPVDGPGISDCTRESSLEVGSGQKGCRSTVGRMSGFDQVGADDANLRAGLGDLAGLVAGSQSLSESLSEIAGFAARVIPGADGVGVAVFRAVPDYPVDASSASTPLVEEIERIQYLTLREGPALSAAQERCPVLSDSLGGERRWSRFGPRAGRLGVHSALALPLMVADRVVGAISVYANGKGAFDDRAVELGELFARPAAVAVHNAQVLAHAQVLTARLQSTLSTRPVIDQAVGLIRGRTGRSADDALDHLRAISQAEQRKLVDVAQTLIDEAVRRARARTPTGPGV